MKKYIAKRVIYMLITMLIITAATFFPDAQYPGRSFVLHGKKPSGADEGKLLCDLWA